MKLKTGHRYLIEIGTDKRELVVIESSKTHHKIKIEGDEARWEKKEEIEKGSGLIRIIEVLGELEPLTPLELSSIVNQYIRSGKQILEELKRLTV